MMTRQRQTGNSVVLPAKSRGSRGASNVGRLNGQLGAKDLDRHDVQERV